MSRQNAVNESLKGAMNETDLKLHRAFVSAASNAKVRGIEWALSFEEFCEIWEQSGHFHERGRRGDQYVMSRKGDLGPYKVGNVFIQTASDNSVEASKTRIKPDLRDVRGLNKPFRRGTPLMYCIEKFGGLIKFSAAIGCSTRQIYRWRDADGMISSSAQTHAILAGRRLGIEIDPSELVYMPQIKEKE